MPFSLLLFNPLLNPKKSFLRPNIIKNIPLESHNTLSKVSDLVPIHLLCSFIFSIKKTQKFWFQFHSLSNFAGTPFLNKMAGHHEVNAPLRNAPFHTLLLFSYLFNHTKTLRFMFHFQFQPNHHLPRRRTRRRRTAKTLRLSKFR